MRRAVLGGIAATLSLTLAACGGDDDKPKDEPKATSTPSADDLPDELGGIVAGTPKDLRWRVPEVPASWKRLKTDPGEAQWQVGRTCVIGLFQPAGLGKAKEPTQEQVLDEYAKRSGQALGTTLDVSNRDTAMFPLVTSSKDVTGSTKVSHGTVTGGKGVEGEVYAYRSGDFALVLTTFCGQGAFAETDSSDFKPFISELAIAATY